MDTDTDGWLASWLSSDTCRLLLSTEAWVTGNYFSGHCLLDVCVCVCKWAEGGVTSAVASRSWCSDGGGTSVTAPFGGGRGGKLLRLSSRSGDGWRTHAVVYTKTNTRGQNTYWSVFLFYAVSDKHQPAVVHLLLGGPRVVSPPLVQASSPAGATTLKQTKKTRSSFKF